MKFTKSLLRLAKKNREAVPESWDNLYEGLIEIEIRQIYSLNKELAIQRKRDIRPEEFRAYNADVEQCIKTVKEILEVND